MNNEQAIRLRGYRAAAMAVGDVVYEHGGDLVLYNAGRVQPFTTWGRGGHVIAFAHTREEAIDALVYEI
jgi:hypothetical protein